MITIDFQHSLQVAYAMERFHEEYDQYRSFLTNQQDQDFHVRYLAIKEDLSQHHEALEHLCSNVTGLLGKMQVPDTYEY